MDGGHGDASRLDRIEALLDRLGAMHAENEERWRRLANSHYLHEDRIAQHEEWLARHEEAIAQHDQWRREQRERDRIIDERIEKLVSAIGELVRLRQTQ